VKVVILMTHQKNLPWLIRKILSKWLGFHGWDFDIKETNVTEAQLIAIIRTFVNDITAVPPIQSRFMAFDATTVLEPSKK